MVPFKETAQSKDDLIKICQKGYEEYTKHNVSKNDFCMYFGFTHGEAITKYYEEYGQLLIDGGFNSGSEAYFSGGINAWKNLRDGKYSFPPFKDTNYSNKSLNTTYQTIFFGCPGTGKSYKVKGIVENHKYFTFRTTFHPDYDYASFVGCYKPVKESIDEHKTPRIDETQIKSDLESILSSSIEKVNDICAYTAKYIESFLSIENFNKFMDSVEGAASYKTPINYILKAYTAMRGNDSTDVGTINYTFIPQVFTNAYVTAWQNPEEKIFLVIEEINRGNCAQIFGDLFQLLDRDTYGKSEYGVKADTDLCKYLEGALGKDNDGIKNGELKLPSNLHILATMNTSDQSLFPMDSAFKRRWAWEYVPIDADCPDSQFKITIGDKTYKWSSFLALVNERIHKLTDSEDKQLGNFFIKSNVDVEEFKSKVMFYLWSEVCKEYEHAGSFFKYNGADGKEVEFTFNSLFPTNESTNGILQGFMTYLGMEEATPEATE